jgi:predicted choloylglycine hydrolase
MKAEKLSRYGYSIRHVSSFPKGGFSVAFPLILTIYLGIGPVPPALGVGLDGTRELKVLHLSGSPYERGLQHGRRLRTEIGKLVSLWKEDLGRQAKTDPDSLIKRFLAETNFMPAIQKWTPDLLDEVKGIADGAGLPFETMFAFQLVDEMWVYLDQPAAGHCSSMGVVKTGAHPAYVAQNMDLEAFRDGFQVVLHIAGNQSLPEQFVFTSAGLIATNGVNNRSIAIACNTLLQLSASRDGLPVAFVVRGVLAQTSPEDAVKFIKGITHASGQNYILGASDRVFDFEASARKVVEFRPAVDGSIVYHTNHPLANDDLKPWHLKQMASLSPEERSKGDSETRLASVKQRFLKPASGIDEGVIKATLRSRDSDLHPVCRSRKEGDPFFTFGATIMTLSDTPCLEVTMGPPDANEFVPLKFHQVPEAVKEGRHK